MNQSNPPSTPADHEHQTGGGSGEVPRYAARATMPPGNGNPGKDWQPVHLRAEYSQVIDRHFWELLLPIEAKSVVNAERAGSRAPDDSQASPHNAAGERQPAENQKP